MEDEHYASFLASTPAWITWDDHEVINDWGGQELGGKPLQYLKVCVFDCACVVFVVVDFGVGVGVGVVDCVC